MAKIDAAERAVDGIIRDLSDRRGLRQEWQGIDEDIRAEIRAVWVQIVRAELAREKDGKKK